MELATLITLVSLVIALFWWLDGKFDKVGDRSSGVTDKLGEHDAADQVIAERTENLVKGLSDHREDFRELRGEVSDIKDTVNDLATADAVMVNRMNTLEAQLEAA